jgi:hypothetical protein
MGVAGLGQIVGIRVLTEALSPEVFGEVNLMVGVAALATMNFFNPTMQALLRYYPIYMQSGDPSPAIHAAIRQLQKTLPVALPILLTSSVLAIAAGWVSLFKVLLLLALAGIDGARLFRFSIMNASRSHKLYGAWQIGEAWGRPIVAYLVFVR